MAAATLLAITAAASASGPGDSLLGRNESSGQRMPAKLLAGEVMAVAYSGFREGQHPDLGKGAANPSQREILEDLEILVAHGFRLIRLYDAGEKDSELAEWGRDVNMTIFFFSAFDEPWKGDPTRPRGAEKHLGLFRVDRTPKHVLQAGGAGER
jgi:exo-beta-1,3-glucanase (GH17 family)